MIAQVVTDVHLGNFSEFAQLLVNLLKEVLELPGNTSIDLQVQYTILSSKGYMFQPKLQLRRCSRCLAAFGIPKSNQTL